MVCIAITSGPRFALVGLWYLLTRKPGQRLPGFVFLMGILRTLTCGGFTYVTSTDDHDWHDIFMISYIIATLPWTLGCIALSPPNPKAIKYRKVIASSFFGTLVPLIYFFIQHKVHRVPGGMAHHIALRQKERQFSDADWPFQLIRPMPSSNGRLSSSTLPSTRLRLWTLTLLK